MPVAHPSLAVKPLTSPGAIEEQVLLEFDDPRRPWLQWADRLKVMGLGGAKPKGILRFNQYDQVISGSPDRPGIALGRLALVGPMLEDKRLVTLDAGRHDDLSGYAYWLVLADAAPRADVRDVIEWIKAEAFRVEFKWRLNPGAARTGRRCDRRPVSPIRSRL